MELQIYKPLNFITMASSELISVIDKFNSNIWTERFNGYGDFELYIPIRDKQFLNLIANNGSLDIRDFMVDLKGSDSTMIIDGIEIETDIENGDYVSITGKSLESILERRIINKQTILKGNINNCIKKLLKENAINPSDSKRKITGLEFENSSDTYILETKISAQQITGDNLYDAIFSLCEACDIGFEIKRKYYKTGNINDFNKFVFRLKRGEDRSKEQFKNPWVVFSNEFGNIFTSNYLNSNSNLKTYALIAGEDLGIGTNRKTREIYIPNYENNINWRLRELFVDARDIQSELDDGTTMPESDYNEALDERGYEKLSEHLPIDSIEGEFDPNGNFKLGRDYFLGDIVQTEYPITGVSKRARITETILSENSEGISYIPTIVLL